MAKRDSAAEAKKPKDVKDEKDGGDSPLLDLSDAAVKKMIRAAKKRGFVTYEELNEVMSAEAVSSEQIEDVLAQLNEMGINVIEADEADAEEREAEDDEPVKVQPDGCIEFEMPQMKACKTVELTTFDNGACNGQARTIVDRETRMLELLFAYDASYRTLMQFAGTFEEFLTDFRFPLLQPLWQMVRTLGEFDNLP
ncbi:MAG: RNA polymerase sigma factor region1.1 domain-containing protein, partial [Pseudomonadota bacterium]